MLGAGYFPLIVAGTCSEFLAVFVPGVDPAALSACKGVASGREHLAHIAHREGVQFLAFGTKGVVPAAVLDDVERLAVSDHFTLRGAECVNFLAILVIDVVPRAGGLNIADFLRLQACSGYDGDEDEENMFHNHIGYLMSFRICLS